MLRRKRYASVVGCLLFLLFLLNCKGSPRDEPWNQSQTEENNQNNGVISLTEEMNQAVKDPLQYYASPKELELHGGVLSPIANSTYVMLYVPAPRVYSMAPIHQSSTLRRFPYFGIYSETGGKLGVDRMVTDVVADLPLETIKKDPRLNSYRIQRFGRDNNFDWHTEDYWVGSRDQDSLMELLSLNILRRAYESAPMSMQWFVLMDESSYISSSGLEKLVSNLNPSEKIVKVGDKANRIGKINMILSRQAVKTLVANNGSYIENMRSTLESIQGISLSQVKTRNISSLGVERTEWCHPEPALFTDLSPWEIQALYHRETRQIDKINEDGLRMIDFYYDFTMPYITPLTSNWAVFPSESHEGDGFSSLVLVDGNQQITLNPHSERDDCEKLCSMTDECLAWQWRQDIECLIETKEVKRGMELNPKYNQWKGSEHQLFVSGYMIDRIKKSRLSSICDTVGDSNTLFNEGWFHNIKRLIKIENSDILKTLQRFHP